VTASAQDKAGWRARLRSRRAALPAGDRRAAADSIRARLIELEAVRAARAIFCFVSRGEEVDTHALIDALADGGRTVLIPRITPTGMIAVEFPGWTALEPGVLGIPAPQSDRAFAGCIDVVITPGVGFTATGDRLGMGRGYYDRWFAAHRYGLSIAICFECQLAPALPTTDSDVRVDLIVTEQRILDTRSAR
jgi:5-formyltetrahydrofolate cyclo-ligase